MESLNIIYFFLWPQGLAGIVILPFEGEKDFGRQIFQGGFLSFELDPGKGFLTIFQRKKKKWPPKNGIGLIVFALFFFFFCGFLQLMGTPPQGS